MKGFTVTLIPKDESGIQRNKDFMQRMKGKLMLGGKMELQPDGRLVCTWRFKRLPYPVQIQMLGQFTSGLDEAKKTADNFTYEVEGIEAGDILTTSTGDGQLHEEAVPEIPTGKMKGYVVWLRPKGASGLKATEQFMVDTKGKLIHDGTATRNENGVVRCEWDFSGKLGDAATTLGPSVLKAMTDALDEAKRDEDNFDYEVVPTFG